MANTALWASYKYGEEWLEALLIYLQKNRDLTIQYIQRELPQINVIEPEGTYLIWIDCRGLKLNDREIQKLLVQKGKLALEPGGKYGTEGEGFVRMNIACPRSTLTDGLNRLKTAFT